MMLLFYYKPSLFIVFCISVVSKQMDEVHRRIANEQQYGEPYSKEVFRYFKFHLRSGISFKVSKDHAALHC